MTITEAAERVLFGGSLEEKLTVEGLDLPDSHRSQGIQTPRVPTRAKELALSDNGVRAQFPGVNVLDQERPRGELLHFLANHELLASELMALVLLKFPNAPEAYRRGVYEAMREEQMHTLMYLRRMKECGLEFGQLPLNSYFWRLVSPMSNPLEFVTKLNLTFEQANLDFSYYYAKKFREVGDNATAAVLEKIYQDEIGHVGHGITWFREWKDPKQSDWQAYSEGLTLPFSASKAKGMAPFNREGRESAGLDEDFITNLAVYSQSRGRNPILHWFNPNAERYALAQQQGSKVTLSKTEKAIEEDLELLMMPLCKQDDLLLLRKTPSVEHLTHLRNQGLTIPELLSATDKTLPERKLGGLRPWAWSQDAADFLEPLKDNVPNSVPDQWNATLPPHFLSKHSAKELREACQLEDRSLVFENEQEALAHLNKTNIPMRLKAPFACSGREQLCPENLSATQRFIQNTLTKHESVIIEPELDVVCEFSAHYDLLEGSAKLRGFTLMQNSAAGQFQAAHVAQKWSSLLPRELSTFLYRDSIFKSLYHETLLKKLPALLTEYTGPVGVDAMIYKDRSGNLALHGVTELNVRHTMGRVALSILRDLNAKKGALWILPKAHPQPEKAFPITDPAGSKLLNAFWQM